MKKYELTNIEKKWFGHTLYRIRACAEFTTIDGIEIKAGYIGGWVEAEHNLSQKDGCWIFDEAMVCDEAIVRDYAIITHNAMICDYATIRDYAMVSHNAIVGDEAIISDNASVRGCAIVRNNAIVCEDAIVCDCAIVKDNAIVRDNAIIKDCAIVKDNAIVCGDAIVGGDAFIFNCNHIYVAELHDKYKSHITFFRTKNREINICYNYELYTIKEFENTIRNWEEEEKNDAKSIIEAAKAHIEL